jgi:hypothetical protein
VIGQRFAAPTTRVTARTAALRARHLGHDADGDAQEHAEDQQQIYDRQQP